MVCSHPPRQIYRDLGPWTIFSPSSLGHSCREEQVSERNLGAMDHLQPVLTWTFLQRETVQFDFGALDHLQLVLTRTFLQIGADQ
jgi:hypothetical protein